MRGNPRRLKEVSAKDYFKDILLHEVDCKRFRFLRLNGVLSAMFI